MKMTPYLIINLFISISLNLCKGDDLGRWQRFKSVNDKQYPSKEESLREMIFKYRSQQIQAHNELYKKGLVSYSMAVNSMTDQLPSDITQNRNGFNRRLKTLNLGAFSGFDQVMSLNSDIPEEMDWRNVTVGGASVVSGVMDQGDCACCYSISCLGALEAQLAIKRRRCIMLSHQNVIDCSNKYGNFGCSGGLPDFTYNYIIANSGINSNAYYPFTGVESKCKYNRKYKAGGMSQWKRVPMNNEEALKCAVANIGPISVAIDASHSSFHFYKAGVYHEPKCNRKNIDHAVLVVGYGTENGIDYWIVKNSWGTSWGDDGYIKMRRNYNDTCGLTTHATYPII